MSLEESKSILRGLTLRVYRLLLMEDEPLSIRRVQRELKLSSPSLAFYHLNKLEDAGLVKQTPSGYLVDKVVLGNLIRFRRTFIPRFLFYASFFLLVLLVELTVYRPSKLTREHIFHILVSLLATLFFIYESIRVWSKEKIRKKH